jgi:hypothetical protein
MRFSKNSYLTAFLLVFVSTFNGACQASRSGGEATAAPLPANSQNYKWVKVTENAEYKTGYNYPLFSIKNKLWAFHAEEIFNSPDGKAWTKAKLPSMRRDVYRSQYAKFGDAIYAFGRNTGNYEKMTFEPAVFRTTDMETWEMLSVRSNLPQRIFFDVVEFKGKLWLLGGFDTKNYYNDVVTWTRVAEKAPWSERNTYGKVLVFKDNLWLLGGGKIDQPPAEDVWNSDDGKTWTRVAEKMYSQPVLGGTPIVFDDKIWLLGVNRNDTFSNGMLVSADGKEWQERFAPWTPRGGVAAAVHDGKLYMTGGKYSVTENGRIKFIYSNDVWYMNRL